MKQSIHLNSDLFLKKGKLVFRTYKIKIKCDSCRLKFDAKIEGENVVSMEESREIISNLQKLFNDENLSKNEKMLLLKLLPKNWSSRKVVNFSYSSRWLVTKCKLSDNQSLSVDKIGNQKISCDTVNQVKLFYENDDNSRIIPGYKDNKCIKNDDGTKTYVQKRLVLYNLRELYLKYKQQYPESKIGFTKFAEFRPEYCVLTGASGAHSVGVCVYHQNVKLLLAGFRNSGVSFNKIDTY